MIGDRRTKDTWTVFKIMGEFVEGFETLADVHPAVSVFGGARIAPGSPRYALASDLGRSLVEEGFAVITGGGPGAMEAANRGAREAAGRSIGLNIKIPMEQAANPYVDTLVTFDYFFARKVMFVKYASGFVFLPGGFGTMDECFETLTLIQTEKLAPVPIALLDSVFWGGLLDWMKETMIGEGTIGPEDLRLFRIFDDPGEAARWIGDAYRKTRPAGRGGARVAPARPGRARKAAPR